MRPDAGILGGEGGEGGCANSSLSPAAGAPAAPKDVPMCRHAVPLIYVGLRPSLIAGGVGRELLPAPGLLFFFPFPTLLFPFGRGPGGNKKQLSPFQPGCPHLPFSSHRGDASRREPSQDVSSPLAASRAPSELGWTHQALGASGESGGIQFCVSTSPTPKPTSGTHRTPSRTQSRGGDQGDPPPAPPPPHLPVTGLSQEHRLCQGAEKAPKG